MIYLRRDCPALLTIYFNDIKSAIPVPFARHEPICACPEQVRLLPAVNGPKPACIGRMSFMGFHLHKHNLPFSRNICDNVQLATSVPTAWSHIPPNDPPAHSQQMRSGDILTPAAAPYTGICAPHSDRMFIAKNSFNERPNHFHPPIPLPISAPVVADASTTAQKT